MSSESYHEPYELISENTRDLHRAVVSLLEELEAIDWYQQRADACNDDQLREILIHNKNEEIEHAMMVLEWLRRNQPKVDEEARTYLFTDGPITEIEHQATNGAASESSEPKPRPSDGSLGIGSLK